MSIGDYVLSGGELPALVVVDAVARLVPGVVGDEQSVAEDSFSRGLLDFPHYTRPAEVGPLRVPRRAVVGEPRGDVRRCRDVLLSGNHAEIRRWRQAGGGQPDAGTAAGFCWLVAERWTMKNGQFCASLRGAGIMSAIELVEKSQLAERPAMKSGDTVRVHVKVREGDKERIQIFEGVVIGLHRGGTRASFTVRKVSFGQGVERIFPLHSPTIQKVEVMRSAKVRRAKLYYLRDLKGKAARMKDTSAKS